MISDKDRQEAMDKLDEQEAYFHDLVQLSWRDRHNIYTKKYIAQRTRIRDAISEIKIIRTLRTAIEPKKERYINILFDGSEGPIAEFVDVENDDGESISIGEWSKKGNYDVLRIKVEGGK